MLVAVGSGLALGVGTALFLLIPSEFNWLHYVGTPWLLVACLLGASVLSYKRAALIGATVLSVAVVVYYVLLGPLLGQPTSSPASYGWLVVALPLGALFGVLGSVLRASSGLPRAILVAVVSSTVIGEALFFVSRTPSTYRVTLLCLIVTASIALIVLILRPRAHQVLAIALAAILAPLAARVEELVFVSVGYV